MSTIENAETKGQKIKERSLRVLVVEDDREIREMVALMVRGMGYAIVTAATGKEALTRLREQMVDIVLLDLMMPEMDGFEFCRAVQRDSTLRNLHIIITSARDTLEDKVKGLELGAADYLTKPFSMTELQARIKVGERIVRYQKTLLEQQEEREFQSHDSHEISRSIEFPPEYYQSGMAILAYFGQVLLDKNPTTQAKVKIEQIGLTVRLTIETPEGEREQIEETLEAYGLVVTGKLPPEQFLNDKLQVMRLKNKLELAALELRQTKELLAYTRDTSQKRIESLEQHVQKLFALVEDGIQTRKDGHELLKDFLGRFDKSDKIYSALQQLAERLERGVGAEDRERIYEALEVIKRERPSVLKELQTLLEGTVTGVTGNAAYSWIMAFINALPK